MADVPVRASRLSSSERRRSLLRAAREVFVEEGFAGAQTQRIAKLAGTSETVMYRVFASKEQLFEEAVCDPLEQLVLRITALAGEFVEIDGPGDKRLSRAAQERMLTLMIEATPLFGAAVLNQHNGTTFYRERIAPLIDLAIKAMREIGYDFPEAEIDPEILFLAIFGMHMALGVEATKTDAVLEPSALAAQIVSLLTDGLAAR